jgi:hypothetical protein
MTDALLVEYYQDLLILQYKNKPKARGHIASNVSPLIIFELSNAVKNGYNIETAIGKQLDVLGKYAGISRVLSDGSITELQDDTNFRKFVKFKIVKNYSNHSLQSIDKMFYDFFGVLVKVDDNFDMSINYTIYGDLTLAKILKFENLFPKPMGVKINVIVSSPNAEFPFIFLHNRHAGKGWGIAAVPNQYFTFSDGTKETFSDGLDHDSTNAGNVPSNDGTGGAWAIQI